MDEQKKAEAYRIGVGVIIILAVFTIGEFMVGSVAIGWWQPLIAIAIFKAYFIMRDYMHLPRLFAGEEESQ